MKSCGAWSAPCLLLWPHTELTPMSQRSPYWFTIPSFYIGSPACLDLPFSLWKYLSSFKTKALLISGNPPFAFNLRLFGILVRSIYPLTTLQNNCLFVCFDPPTVGFMRTGTISCSFSFSFFFFFLYLCFFVALGQWVMYIRYSVFLKSTVNTSVSFNGLKMKLAD